jgi:hypothetical protein
MLLIALAQSPAVTDALRCTICEPFAKNGSPPKRDLKRRRLEKLNQNDEGRSNDSSRDRVVDSLRATPRSNPSKSIYLWTL